MEPLTRKLKRLRMYELRCKLLNSLKVIALSKSLILIEFSVYLRESLLVKRICHERFKITSIRCCDIIIVTGLKTMPWIISRLPIDNYSRISRLLSRLNCLLKQSSSDTHAAKRRFNT